MQKSLGSIPSGTTKNKKIMNKKIIKQLPDAEWHQKISFVKSSLLKEVTFLKLLIITQSN